MKYFFITLLAIVTIFHSHANQPRRSSMFIQYSQNGAFYFRSIPYSIHPYWLGKIDVYQTGSDRLLYSIEDCMNEETLLNNDGNILIIKSKIFKRNSGTPADTLPINTQNVLWFYDKDQLIDSFPLNTLSPSIDTGVTGHIGTWLRRTFLQSDTLYIITYKDNTIRIPLKDRSKIDRQSNELIMNRFKAKIAGPVRKYEEIVFPCKFYRCVPDLENGMSLDSAFVPFIKKVLKQAGFTPKHYNVSYSVLAARDGHCHLTDFELNDPKTYKRQLILPELKQKAVRWIAKQKVKTDLIPEPCEKWLFESYLEL